MLQIIGGFCWVVTLILGVPLWRGYVLSVIWNWFMVPIFHLPILALIPAIGVSIVVGFLTSHYETNSNNKGKSFTELMTTATIIAILVPALSLLTGWVVHFYL